MIFPFIIFFSPVVQRLILEVAVELKLGPGPLAFNTDFCAFSLAKLHSAQIERRLLQEAFTTNSIDTSM
jgi:hypothetical protein